MERERAEATQELLLKAHVMTQHTLPQRTMMTSQQRMASPTRNLSPSPPPFIPPPAPLSSSPPIMRMQDLHPQHLDELEQLHREALGQLKDVS